MSGMKPGKREKATRKKSVKPSAQRSKAKPTTGLVLRPDAYPAMLSGLVELMEEARSQAVRHVNAMMTASYWEIGRRIVEQEQGGEQRAGYGEELIERLSADLTSHFGRGFSQTNLKTMRLFYLAFRSAGSGSKTGFRKPRTKKPDSV